MAVMRETDAPLYRGHSTYEEPSLKMPYLASRPTWQPPVVAPTRPHLLIVGSEVVDIKGVFLSTWVSSHSRLSMLVVTPLI